MRGNKHVIFMVALTALLALVVAACCHRTPEQRAEHMVQRLISTLKLDAAQSAQLEKIKEEFLAKRSDMMKMREETMNDLKEMMMSPELDRARLNTRTEKIQVHTSDLIQFISAKFAELHDVLTPEQRSKLVEEMEKHAERAHRW